ncbi:BTAD domain-containing putative transcriptional regulator [Actinoplanes sp. Pm04-4]|uniref:BTAD domain-containing putative transcriptional regulator n=1 Tax=Paractinoplanes pyxinae TaxID=2997416 RepID=A0ABT4BGI7_9ACTN|nr:BTAD domain-containing putative transcriptional regulator [Actinoplanes pyxinae]MCY1145561.1 BTAD domain-containing putative transcriptional regulator [Actinoplanes pyxinae]
MTFSSSSSVLTPRLSVTAVPARRRAGITAVSAPLTAASARVDSPDVGIGVLGPLTVGGDGDRPARASSRDRVVLAALVAAGGDAVRPEQLAEALWGDHPPASWRKVLQGCVARLRRMLGATAIETVPPGYRLAVDAGEIDARRFERLLERARELLALDAADQALFAADAALALWRGPALPEVEAWEPGRIEAGRLAELRLEAEELRVEAALGAGRVAEVLADARAQVDAEPLRERRWALLAEAQYRSGRQGEALAGLRRARHVLNAELGLDPGPELVAVERAILRQDPSLSPDGRPAGQSPVCPYLGLVPYDVGDAEAFFGREDDTAACLDRLAATGVLVVVGPSGGGKSSLVRAGLAAKLRGPVTVLHPGPWPAAPDPPAAGPVVVDQAEEVVTLCTDPGRRSAFLTALVAHAERAPLIVALRADRLGEVCEHPGFARLAERGLYVLGAMRESQLRTAIEAPARRAGLLLEPGLVDLLVRDVEGEPGALPLLSHALRQTWLRREGRTLTVAGYRTTGGIRGAVAHTAEELYERTPVTDRPELRELLLSLANRGRVPRRLLAAGPGRLRILEELVAARLVTSGESTVALAHEALTRVWPRMRSWLDEDAEGQRLRRHLSVAADAWETMGRPGSELYRGARLARAVEWHDHSRPALSPTEEAFLAAGRELADAETAAAARINRRLRALLAAAVVLLVVAGAAGVYAGRQAERARAAARSAEARRIGALARTTADAGQSLWLAAGAVRLDDTTANRADLLSALGRNPQLIRVINGPERAASRAAVSADGTTLIVLNGGRAGLFDTRTYAGAWHPSVVPPAPTAVALRPDGEQAAVVSGPVDAPVVSVVGTRRATVQPVRPGRLAYDSVAVAATYSADGRRLAVVYQRGEFETSVVWVWSVNALDRPPSTVAVPWLTDVVRFGPGGLLHTAGPGGEAVFDVATGRRVRSSPAAGPLLELSPDGRWAARATARGGEVVLTDVASGREMVRLARGGTGPLQQLRFSPDSRLLAGSAGDNTVTVWDVPARETTEVLRGHATTVVDLAYGADGATLHTSDRDGTTLVWDLRGDRRVVARRALPVGADLSDAEAVIAPGGDRVAFGSRDRLTVADLRGGRPPVVIETGHRRRHGVAWRPDGARLATTGDEGHVRVWDADTGRLVVARQLSDRPVLGLAYSRDGTRLIVTDDRVLQLDAATLRPVADLLRLPGEPAGQPVIAPDGRTVVAFPSEPARSAAYVDLSAATARDQPIGVAAAAAAFAPDGRGLAVAGRNGEVLLLDAAGSPVRPAVPAHDGPAGPVSWSADGRTFVVGGADGRVSVWDGRTGEPLGAVTPARTGVRTYPAFRADGHTVTIVSTDGAVHTWDARPGEWVAHACRIAGPDFVC